MQEFRIEDYLDAMYFLGSVILAPLFMAGVVKRSIILMLPGVLIAPASLVVMAYDERRHSKWTGVLISLFAVFCLMIHPVIGLWREILQERRAKAMGNFEMK
uniref:Uncharacterized protein n=1 Tax=Stomoxys calcitrans TaxID=35570 RepID=A0A1I8PP94_STOCA